MVSTVLPIKESARELILEAANTLQPRFPEMSALWRQRIFEEFNFEERAMLALERLNMGVSFMVMSHANFNEFTENLHYYGTASGQVAGGHPAGGALSGDLPEDCLHVYRRGIWRARRRGDGGDRGADVGKLCRRLRLLFRCAAERQ